jgi:4-oxalocrotonate tautomerase
MPFANVKVIEGVLSAAQKKELITRITDALVAAEGENLRHLTWVVIEEVKSGDWAIGGQPVTTADVQAIAAGPPKAA